MKLWAYKSENPCCSADDLNDAALISDQLGIDFEIIDARKQFKKMVVDYYIKELTSGRTPNPCVVCNDQLKFGLLLNYASKNSCNYVATGHYARIQFDGKDYHLKKAADPGKDQSYFLFMLDQKRLARILFPLGELDKSSVRAIARKAELITCSKRDSQELCFMPPGGASEFIRKYAHINVCEGIIVNKDNVPIGRHKGLPFYTIGQRKGIGVYTSKPVYVVKMNAADNRIMVDEKESLTANTFIVKDVHWIAKEEPHFPLYADVKIRYGHKGSKAEIRKKDDALTVTFENSQRAITPGQAAVFYNADEVLGGGWISEVKK